MTEMPSVRYAKSGGIHIAYMSVGTGPEEFLWTPGASSNVEDFCQWNLDFVEALSRHGRITWFDKRGTGMSDRDASFTFEERMDDIRAVKDLTVGSGFKYADRGTHALKGLDDEWHIYAAAV